MKLYRIKYDDIDIKLKKPIDYKIDQWWCGAIFENERLGIFETGRDLTIAKAQFCAEVHYVWQRYNGMADSTLSKDVLQIKRYLNARFKRQK